MLKTTIWGIKLIISLIKKERTRKIADKLLSDGNKEEHSKLAYEEVKDWATWVMNSTGSEVHVYGIENLPKEGAMLFISNHQSNFDIPLLLSSIPIPNGVIAKKELGNVPFITRWMKHINCLFMDREDMKQSMQIIIDGIKLLKSGYSMVIFPEGTRSKGGPVGEFKAGSFKLATKAKVPIVPLTIDGTHKIFEGNHNRINSAKVNLYIHKPIYTDTLSKEEVNNLHNSVKNTIIADLPD